MRSRVRGLPGRRRPLSRCTRKVLSTSLAETHFQRSRPLWGLTIMPPKFRLLVVLAGLHNRTEAVEEFEQPADNLTRWLSSTSPNRGP
jgi:hypothetical protein